MIALFSYEYEGNGASAALDSIVDSLLAHTCLRTPIILRFPDIIGHRIAQLTVSTLSQSCMLPSLII